MVQYRLKLFLLVAFFFFLLIFLCASFAQATFIVADWDSDAREGVACAMPIFGLIAGALAALIHSEICN